MDGTSPSWAAAVIAAAGDTSPADWAAVVAAVVAALTAAGTAVMVARMQARQNYRNTLHDARLSAYQKLFAILEPLAIDGRSAPDKQVHRRIADEMTSWYYTTGGLVMSSTVRDEFFALRAEFAGIEDWRAEDKRLKDLEPLRRAASDLRSILTDEVLSRKERT